MASYTQVRSSIDNIKTEIKKLEIWYLERPLEVRRDIRLPNAEDRFYCAAIFQHRPSQEGPDGWSIEDVGFNAEIDDEQKIAEACPMTDHYYTNINAAEEAIQDGELEEACDLVEQAWKQVEEIREMLARMCKKPEKQLRVQDDWHILYGWSEVCYWVQKGLSVQKAIQRALPEAMARLSFALADEQYHGPREFFKYDPRSKCPAEDIVYPACFPPPFYTPIKEDWVTAFKNYQNTFASLPPYASDFPYPLLIDNVRNETVLCEGRLDYLQRLNIQVKVFFIRGFGIECTFTRILQGQQERPEELGQVGYGIRKNPVLLKSLYKHLLHKEVRRWHGDQLNKRSGTPGEVDESIAADEVHKEIIKSITELKQMVTYEMAPTVHEKAKLWKEEPLKNGILRDLDVMRGTMGHQWKGDPALTRQWERFQERKPAEDQMAKVEDNKVDRKDSAKDLGAVAEGLDSMSLGGDPKAQKK